jgi:DNA-directed RNA polymerase specialized sigma24 family protein
MTSAGDPPRVPADNPLFLRDDWPLVRKKVVAAAFRFVGSLREANDLVQYAILWCLADARAAYKWPHKPLVNFLIRVLSRHAFSLRRHLESFPEVQALEDSSHADSDEPTQDPDRRGAVVRTHTKNPEELYLEAEAEFIYRRRVAKLLAHTQDDALVQFLIGAVLRGEDSPKDAAEAEGYSASDVYDARDRMSRACFAVLDAERKEQQAKEKS